MSKQKLNEFQIRTIKRMLNGKLYYSNKRIAKIFNLSVATIGRIKRGVYYSDIGVKLIRHGQLKNSNRICSVCKKEKPKGDFRSWKDKLGRPLTRCVACDTEMRLTYRVNNKEKEAVARSAQSHRRRLAKVSNGRNDLSQEDIDFLRDLFVRCAYCKVKDKELTIEHMVPISRGGKNTLNNVTLACNSCNAKKGVSTYSEHMDSLRC